MFLLILYLRINRNLLLFIIMWWWRSNRTYIFFTRLTYCRPKSNTCSYNKTPINILIIMFVLQNTTQLFRIGHSYVIQIVFTILQEVMYFRSLNHLGGNQTSNYISNKSLIYILDLSFMQFPLYINYWKNIICVIYFFFKKINQ